MTYRFEVLDLNFQNVPHTIAVYLFRHTRGVALIESGPGSTVPALQQALAQRGYALSDITDVLLTHIHLDHAGAAGFLARQGATIHVHPVGAPHMLRPEKLLQSAARIYGDMMDTLWGEFLPVPEERLHVPQDEEAIVIGDLRFLPLDTPGHAYHHYAYLFEGVCFSGDVGGVRLPLRGTKHLRLPMPPPEFHLEKWRASVARLRAAAPRAIVPTHFGPFEDVAWHLDALDRELDDVERFLLQVMPAGPTIEELQQRLDAWVQAKNRHDGIDEATHRAYETANPTWMSASGLARYWKKFRQNEGADGARRA